MSRSNEFGMPPVQSLAWSPCTVDGSCTCPLPPIPADPLLPGWAPGSGIQMTVKHRVHLIHIEIGARKPSPAGSPGQSSGGCQLQPPPYPPVNSSCQPLLLLPGSTLTLSHPLLPPRTQHSASRLASLASFPPRKVAACTTEAGRSALL